ncbi:terminase large subunit [Serratia phage vB_SlqS_ZDD2]|nr:terminase large subunit [Serratia phage vB_SlqS_ZDD2]
MSGYLDVDDEELLKRRIRTLKKRLSNRFWRLNNLYFITDKDGKEVRFRMSKEQLDYFQGMHTRNIILKARQLGFTTEQCIIQLDMAMFMKAKCAMIAHTLKDAGRLFREKVKFAYEKLPAEIKAANPARNDTAGELVFAKGGSLSVSTSFRGGTLKSLHVSEFGKICAKNPEKAREIVTGAFEAVSHRSYITLESTAEGRNGYFFEYAQEAEKNMLSGADLTALDWKFFFYAWWKNEDYSLPVSGELDIPEVLAEYFSELESKKKISLTDGQKLWYYIKWKTLGEDMKREYPATPEEAFQQSVEGAYYQKQFRQIYVDKRIVKDLASWAKDGLVHTFWDLGVGDSTAIWFVREVGNEFHVIDYYENSGEGLQHYMQVLHDKKEQRGYKYGEHWAPHDIENREFAGNGKTRKQLAAEGYILNDGNRHSIRFNVAPNMRVDEGIEQVRKILERCVFDERRTEEGVKMLESYRKEWDEKRGMWKDKPLHDFTSHCADAFRYFAVAKNVIKSYTKALEVDW